MIERKTQDELIEIGKEIAEIIAKHKLSTAESLGILATLNLALMHASIKTEITKTLRCKCGEAS